MTAAFDGNKPPSTLDDMTLEEINLAQRMQSIGYGRSIQIAKIRWAAYLLLAYSDDTRAKMEMDPRDAELDAAYRAGRQSGWNEALGVTADHINRMGKVLFPESKPARRIRKKI